MVRSAAAATFGAAASADRRLSDSGSVMFNVRQTDLQRLNSLTKYPSIPTYHTLDPKDGCLVAEAVRFDGDVIATEKIDGTNARLICLPDGT